MAYYRFLTNADYKALVSDEQFEQIVRGDSYRLVQAEQSAEMNFLEYLDQYYEIEKELQVGKRIRDYNSGVSYPAQAWFAKDGVIYKTLTAINGRKAPTEKVYWELTEEPSEIDGKKLQKYSQLAAYANGDIVLFGSDYWVCRLPNGYELDNIRIPGYSAWDKVETVEWEPNMEWALNRVCYYNGNFYEKIQETETEDVLTPEEDDDWAMIGAYSANYDYDYSSGHDYVEFESSVFVPVFNPNADKIVEGENIVRDEPRNANIVTHMTRIACYYLHQLISPINISESRRWAYEDSMSWLANASKFRINPKIPRKKESDGLDKVDWALETFQREFNPNENMWLI